MSAIPAPVVGKALEWLGKAAAAAAAAIGANEVVKDRPDTKTREADCSEASDDGDCGLCLLINGRLGEPPTARYISKSNRINYDYQLQVANMHAGPERFGYVRRGDNSNTLINIDFSVLKDFFGTGGTYTTLEWMFGDVAFDGFWRKKCTVIETKANYAHAFHEDGTYKKKFLQPEIEGWSEQFRAQALAMNSTKPQGKLEWHFMQAICYEVGVENGIPLQIARLTPYRPLGIL
ncbi:Tox-REase-5 domain-containing protein [Stenotrophomonas rhizophila]